MQEEGGKRGGGAKNPPPFKKMKKKTEKRVRKGKLARLSPLQKEPQVSSLSKLLHDVWQEPP